MYKYFSTKKNEKSFPAGENISLNILSTQMSEFDSENSGFFLFTAGIVQKRSWPKENILR